MQQWREVQVRGLLFALPNMNQLLADSLWLVDIRHICFCSQELLDQLLQCFSVASSRQELGLWLEDFLLHLKVDLPQVLQTQTTY